MPAPAIAAALPLLASLAAKVGAGAIRGAAAARSPQAPSMAQLGTGIGKSLAEALSAHNMKAPAGPTRAQREALQSLDEVSEKEAMSLHPSRGADLASFSPEQLSDYFKRIS